MEQKQRDNESGDSSFDLGYTIPSIASISEKLDKAIAEKALIQKEHQEQNDKEDQGKGKAVKKKQKSAGGEMCICESPHCRIGPMMGYQGEDR